jgi:hypothetical protein
MYSKNAITQIVMLERFCRAASIPANGFTLNLCRRAGMVLAGKHAGMTAKNGG